MAAASLWNATPAPIAGDPPPVVRLNLALPEDLRFSPVAPIAPFPALSPDGRYLALLLVKGSELPSLFIHTMKGLEHGRCLAPQERPCPSGRPMDVRLGSSARGS